LKKKELYERINRPDIRFEAISKYIKGTNILDFGFGTGYFINRLAAKNLHVTGIDFSPQIKIKKETRTVLISLKSIKHIKLLNFEEQFTTIIVSEVLEHLKTNEIREVLIFFYKWLSDNGRLIITVPYKEKLEENRVLCPYCLKWFHPWLHVQSFDEKRIYKLLRVHGFLIEKIEFITLFELFNLPSFIRRFLNFLLSHFLKKARIWMIIIANKCALLSKRC
jgi:2-polyprenyl-3-methyl-5-hydroxy-6-metoxy-1,4-benzoquinol methylase